MAKLFCSGILLLADAKCLFCTEQQSVQGSPIQECPVGTVLDAADNKCHEQIEIVAQTPHTIAAKGNIDVVLEPG